MANNNYFMNDKRVLVLSGEVTDKSVEYLIERINVYNLEDQLNEDTYKDFSREPIMLLVNSCGGSVYAGSALIGAMEMSVTPIFTVALGLSASMGFYILLAGHERFAHRFASVMYHECSTYGWGRHEEIKRNTEHIDHLQKMFDNFVLERTSITQDKLDSVRKDLRDWFISTDDLVKYGIVSEVI